MLKTNLILRNPGANRRSSAEVPDHRQIFNLVVKNQEVTQADREQTKKKKNRYKVQYEEQSDIKSERASTIWQRQEAGVGFKYTKYWYTGGINQGVQNYKIKQETHE